MDISEAEAGIMVLTVAQIDLRVIADDTVELYEQVADEAGVALTHAPGNAVIVSADSVRLRQAVANLVDNAIKYTARGGGVSVEIDIDPVSREAVVRVRDTGRGIPQDAIRASGIGCIASTRAALSGAWGLASVWSRRSRSPTEAASRWRALPGRVRPSCWRCR